jgi:hypothetical protein
MYTKGVDVGAVSDERQILFGIESLIAPAF